MEKMEICEIRNLGRTFVIVVQGEGWGSTVLCSSRSKVSNGVSQDTLDRSAFFPGSTPLYLGMLGA